MSQSQQQTQATYIKKEEIRKSIYLPYVKGTSEKLILKSHTLYTESTLGKLLYKLKDWIATEGKSNIVYEIEYSNWKATCFGEFKQSLKSRSNEHKRSVRNCNCEKNKIAKHCWEADHNLIWNQ